MSIQSLTDKTIFWTVAALVIALLPHLLAMPLWLSALTLLPVGWRLIALRLPLQQPGMLLRGIAALVGFSAVYFAYGTFWGRRAGASLLCVMLALKLLELRRSRDALLIVSTTFFLIATQFLFHQNLLLMIYLIVATWASLSALFQIQQNDWPALPAVKSRIHPLLHASGRLLVMAIPLTVLLFLFFPRLNVPLWGMPEQALDAKTGLSDSMSPGKIQDFVH